LYLGKGEYCVRRKETVNLYQTIIKDMKPSITIIGAGISGLSVGLHLHREGFSVKIIEASDRAGGRIKTDSVDGFRLDRGFQVLLTSYPEANALGL
jgi:phytoene dehydrogenase-like protein